MNEKVIARAEEIINNKKVSFCTLALIDEKGYPTASTVSVSKADGIKWLAFCVGLNENKAKRAAKNNRACVCVNAGDFNITLVGTAEVLTDPETKKEMWYPGCEEHWAGADDPEYCVLRFNTERYNLFVGWESAEGVL